MSYRLFIADDSKVLCSRLAEMLSEFNGLDIVGQAHNAPDAIRSIKKTRPHLVILDIRMSGGSGIHVLDQIRKDGLSTKVIMFTNYPYPQYRKRCLEAGADYFFVKYTEFHKLFKVIGQLVKKHNNSPKTQKLL